MTCEDGVSRGIEVNLRLLLVRLMYLRRTKGIYRQDEAKLLYNRGRHESIRTIIDTTEGDIVSNYNDNVQRT